MSFPSFIFIIQKYTNIRIGLKSCREEVWFDFSHKKMSSCTSEKASESISRGGQASVTVEMIVCVPLFIYAALCLIWMLEIRSIQTVVRCGLHSAGKEMSSEWTEHPMLSLVSLESKLISAIGEEKIERSSILGGVKGLSCDKSFVYPGSGIYELKVAYQVKIPFPFFSIGGLHMEEKMRMKAWNGYEEENLLYNPAKEIVYITETGIVYHLDSHCNYLDLSVRTISKEALVEARNEDGEKYSRCLACGGGVHGQNVYITSYGSAYHTSLSCIGLKRKIFAVPIDEVKGRVVCSKCGKRG